MILPIRKLHRWENWDYAQPGAYFVTICVQNMEWLLGTVCDGKMDLNEWGKIAEQCWIQIPEHFAMVRIGEFVVMPNHLHGIIYIDLNMDDGNSVGNAYMRSETGFGTPDVTRNACMRSLRENREPEQPIVKNFGLFRIIQQYKSAVSREINRTNSSLYFQWQKSFHDRVVRDEDELNRIRWYIINNPQNWPHDPMR